MNRAVVQNGIATKAQEKRLERTELAKQDQAKETSLATLIYHPVSMLGEEDKDTRPPAHRLVQNGTTSAHAVGSLINTVTDEALVVAESPFIPYHLPRLLILDLRSTYRAWSDTAGPPLYSGKALRWVEENHPEHFEEGSGSGGEGQRAERVVSLIALLEGHAEPILIEFAKSAVRCAVLLSQLEKSRTRRGANAGWYQLGAEAKSWQKYSWIGWTKPTVEDPPDSELERALPLVEAIQQIANRPDQIEPEIPVAKPVASGTVTTETDDDIPF